MAVRTATQTNPPRMRSKLFSWAALAAGDEGNSIDVLQYSTLILSSQLSSGAGSTLQLHGSHDGTNWFPLAASTTPLGTSTLSTVVAQTFTVFPRYIKPITAGGTSVIVCNVLAK